MGETRTKPKAKQQQAIAGEAPTSNLPAVQEQLKNFMVQFHARQGAYAPLLPPHIPFEKFEASVRAAVAKDPELVTKCNHATVFRACSEAAELGLSLSPTLREADILKVWNKQLKGLEAQFRPRFIGYIKLAKQSGEVTDIDAHEVYEWDAFDYAYGAKPYLNHKPGPKPADYDKLPFWGVTHAYCTWEIAGKVKFEVMELADLIRIMNRSSSKDRETGEIRGPWLTDKPEMCRKTVVRRASKYMPLSAERMRPFAAAVNYEDKTEGGERVTIRDGEVVDITEFSETESQPQTGQKQQTPTGKQQMDDLESRMAGGGQQQTETKAQQTTIDNPAQQKQPAQQQPAKKAEKLDPPVVNGRKDLATWIPLAEAAIAELSVEERVKFKELHGKELDACEMTMPDKLDNLVKMLP